MLQDRPSYSSTSQPQQPQIWSQISLVFQPRLPPENISKNYFTISMRIYYVTIFPLFTMLKWPRCQFLRCRNLFRLWIMHCLTYRQICYFHFSFKMLVFQRIDSRFKSHVSWRCVIDDNHSLSIIRKIQMRPERKQHWRCWFVICAQRSNKFHLVFSMPLTQRYISIYRDLAQKGK